MKLIIFIVAIASFLCNCVAVPRNRTHYQAFGKMEAEHYSSVHGSSCVENQDKACPSSSLYRMARNEPGNYLVYNDVDFEGGAELVTFQLWGWRDDKVTGSILLRLDSPTATPFGTVAVGPTGTNCYFMSITNFLSTFPSGVHDLYLTFSSSNNDDLVDIDWFQFKRLMI